MNKKVKDDLELWQRWENIVRLRISQSRAKDTPKATADFELYTQLLNRYAHGERSKTLMNKVITKILYE